MASKLLGRSVRWASALLVAPALVAGCAENYASVEIRQFMVAQASPASPLACTVAPDPSGTKVLSSILDVALRDNYVAFPLIQNNMFQTRSAEFNRPDQRAITAQFVDVELTTADGMTRLTLSNAGAPVPSSYRIPVRSDLIPAGNGTTPGFGVMEMPLIPASVGSLQLGSVSSSSEAGCRSRTTARSCLNPAVDTFARLFASTSWRYWLTSNPAAEL